MKKIKCYLCDKDKPFVATIKVCKKHRNQLQRMALFIAINGEDSIQYEK